ncbi:hypothetical protein O3S68_22090 [Kosakonia sp. SOY2]|uniref:type II toxin-antitoxin system RelB/DinJ family antitoxin n=1 Tax=Kosakonia sp. SOY2 TaxID=3014557 RepID=UPI0022AC6AEB|nr:hypothetical protein [Kosakonia sp. SOY2]MCZ3384969.1 hypothetical protein [Kosakonia sp. SOY2]
MPLAMINARLDAALKERVDPKLQQLGCTATQAITALYQFVDQNDRLPFTIETRVWRPEESLQNVLDGLLSARPRLAEIARLLSADTLTEDACHKYCQALAIDIGMIKDNMRLCGASGRAGEHLLHFVQSSLGEAYLALTLCHSILEDDPNRYGKNLFLKKEKVFADALERAETRMTEMGLHQAGAVIASCSHEGTYCTVEVYRPESYQYGAWLVRVMLKSTRRGQSLPDSLSWQGFAFPTVTDHVFNVASPYSTPVSGKHGIEIGFRFVEGYAFFHLYPNREVTEHNAVNADGVAATLGAYMDRELEKIIVA